MLVQARGAVVWLARNNTDRTYPEIALLLGGRDHTTMIHAKKVADERRKTDAMFHTMLLRIEGQVRWRALQATAQVVATQTNDAADTALAKVGDQLRSAGVTA